MRTHPFLPIVWLAFASMTASCAGSVRTFAVAPPRLSIPTAAATPCDLPGLPERPTQADLESVYAARGAAIVSCDAARRLAIEVLTSERRLVDAWRTGPGDR